MPSNFIRDQLVDTVKTMLAPLPDQAGVAIQEEGRKAIDHLIEQVRKVLDNDVLALEAGLEAARIEMKRGREEALRRRDAISVARGRLAALQAALAGLTAKKRDGR